MEDGVVIDNGSSLIRVGIAGDDTSKCIVLSGVYLHDGKEKIYSSFMTVPDNAVVAKVPITRGVITNYDVIEKLWTYAIETEIDAVIPEKNFLLTESATAPIVQRKKSAELFLEKLNAKGVEFENSLYLSLLSSGRTTGCVVESGDGVTHVGGYSDWTQINEVGRCEYGGSDVTKYISGVLRSQCGVSESVANYNANRVKTSLCKIALPDFSAIAEMNKTSEDPKYTLPDGRQISIGIERYIACESLFNPELIGIHEIGIHELVVNYLNKLDKDIQQTMLLEMVLTGGNTLFDNLYDRLDTEISKRVTAKHGMHRVIAPPERIMSTWIGGSILMSLSTNASLIVTKKMYDEKGADILRLQQPSNNNNFFKNGY
ncbi:actin, muscle, putative [Entamoeba invadens IP1]|uniref:Actin, muscle, putative n=1 Tax=Entamoeba invadens IP1 TaxID=370355 RepID=L7FJS0_ENTIV|nr:actin, muscle, putative [Entamoeba invadens IP1]ELP84815.1 actin, muscle, putative [Entamoeba invadens IP1]|eukprot:XP_004184161.1 actin, muscle, putative [Entamoeba invadens IP1]